MPLMHGKSRAAFSKNVATEMDAGKPQKQALAIAYKMKREAMARGGMAYAEGGEVDDDDEGGEFIQARQAFAKRQADADYDRSEAKYQGQLDKRRMRKEQRAYEPTINEPYYRDKDVGVSRAGKFIRDANTRNPNLFETGEMENARQEHMKTLVNMVLHGRRDRSNFDEGGMVCDYDDLVKRVMKKRMSEGGMVANETMPMAPFADAEFDELVKDDELEPTIEGDEEIGDATVEGEEHDLVSRIMRSRAKKDRNPRPA